MKSIRTLEQKKSYTKKLSDRDWITVDIRFDDRCMNGHNTFSITGAFYESGRMVSCGCLHDEIRKHFPNLEHLIKWHLCSTDGPMHYVENAKYWAGFTKWEKQNVENLHSVIVYGAVPEFDNNSMRPEYMNEGELVCWLNARLPKLLETFKKEIEEIGFVW